ncbi:uncharacterized protein BO87DRAFT_390494 [Aspergillus neoniger CBS 115656]|uniref:Zona occludens toxin N-terminal domain-containing protein n=1 Tax=Aspergillus neoniger (strain CBS 115656) TaxID=1448310 RepID=A0A318YYY9_ASPNB|nr:hypothetical protein BO87DRAFT_390494 [Aspergillus neoniger CBS 115656]PYH30122.1 hypothetical protein BO87DRAFT_390494 [Aspergillus neoniger CBS 115656]
MAENRLLWVEVIETVHPFKNKILDSGLTLGQLESLKHRLEMLESFMPQPQVTKATYKRAQTPPKQGLLWEPKARQLTILDLSSPRISPGTAWSRFNITLAIFMEQESDIGRVLALDEAHKYMRTSSEAQAFAETLLSVVCPQRHLAARIIISTQDPTKHLAGAATNPFARKKGKAGGRGTDGEEGQLDEANEKSLFDHIYNLRVGKALLFSSSSIVDVAIDEEGGYELRRLGSEYLAFRVRQRITKDGVKGLLAV